MILGEWNRHRGGPDDLGENRVCLKTPPRKHHLIPIGTADLDKLLAQCRRPAPHRNIIKTGKRKRAGQCLPELRDTHIRVAIHSRCRIGHCLHCLRQRRMRGFITGQLQCIRHTRAGNISGNGVKVRSNHRRHNTA